MQGLATASPYPGDFKTPNNKHIWCQSESNECLLKRPTRLQTRILTRASQWNHRRPFTAPWWVLDFLHFWASAGKGFRLVLHKLHSKLSSHVTSMFFIQFGTNGFLGEQPQNYDHIYATVTMAMIYSLEDAIKTISWWQRPSLVCCSAYWSPHLWPRKSYSSNNWSSFWGLCC